MKIYFYKKCGVFEAYKKVSDFLYAEGLHGKHGAQMFSVFGYVYLGDEKILARKYGFFKAAAVGAIASCSMTLNSSLHSSHSVIPEMTFITSFVSLSHVSPTTTGYISSTYLGDDQRQLAYIEDNLRDSLMSFCSAKSVTVLTIERTTPISCIAAPYFLAIFLVTSFATAAGALPLRREAP